MYVVLCNIYYILHKLYMLHTERHTETHTHREGGGKKSEKAFHIEIMGEIKYISVYPQNYDWG